MREEFNACWIDSITESPLEVVPAVLFLEALGATSVLIEESGINGKRSYRVLPLRGRAELSRPSSNTRATKAAS